MSAGALAIATAISIPAARIYFDPATPELLIGRHAVVEHILKLYRNPNVVRNEYLNSHVTVSDAGDLAVLTYNLRSFVADEEEGEKLLIAWNTTEVYRLIDGQWRIVHSNWALTKPAGDGPVPF